MNAILLSGDPGRDRVRIGEHWKTPDTVFLLDRDDSDQMLYEYIDNLHLPDKALYKLRICEELTGLDVDYREMGEDTDAARDIGAMKSEHAGTLSELLGLIHPDKISYVTVNGDANAGDERKKAVRIQLGRIVQQMVYLQLPLHKIRVRTEDEMEKAEAVRVFEKNIERLKKDVQASRERLDAEKDDFFDNQLFMGTLGALERIAGCLDKSTQNEMKITVAATKKTGKSVIVNSIIEEELAPTSLTLATPNNTISLSLQTSSISRVYCMDSGMIMSGRFFCLPVFCRSSISAATADHTITS